MALQRHPREGGNPSGCMAVILLPSAHARSLHPRHVLASAMPLFPSQHLRTRYSPCPLVRASSCRGGVPQATRKRGFLDSYRFVAGRLKVTGNGDHQRSGGREAALCKATTSGETVVYDAAGKLRFHGGITGARGHIGDNAGCSAIEVYANAGFTATTRPGFSDVRFLVILRPKHDEFERPS
jgi:hypothetical protein